MRVTALRLGKHFGELAYMRGLVTYKISPFEQKAFAGILNSIPKTFRRIGGNLFYIGFPFSIGYLVFTETEKEFHRINRKDPAAFANDQ